MLGPETSTKPQELSPQEKLLWCLNNLGQRITAVSIGYSDVSRVDFWMMGTVPDDDAPKVALLYDAATQVSDTYDAQTARAFLRSSNPYLGDESPSLAIADAGIDEADFAKVREEVMVAATAFAE